MKAKLMGILNATPDSFYAESRRTSACEAIQKAIQMQEEGADILDIGGESSRPGASPISAEEEIDRILPILEGLKLAIPLSIDTMKPHVAKAAIKAGASMINDIGGFALPEMIEVAAEEKVEVCVMHMLGNPQTMQRTPHYPQGVVPYLLEWFEKKISSLIQSGINPDKIIVDPGIGFGKTVADNLEIIHNLPKFKRLGCPVLLGISRKSFMGKILNKPPEELLSATLAMNAIALAMHADIIRVHDVKEHRSIIDMMDVFTSLGKE